MSNTTTGDDERRVLVLNPESGSGDHAPEVHGRANDHGFEVRETAAAGDAVEFAREAAVSGADLVAAAGGDGTLNEVVRGIDRAEALDDVTFGVVPSGTGNNFAGNVGIRGIRHAFEVIESGERRTIDLGYANGQAFLNSCVGGLTADASANTSSELKERLGIVAYVVNTLRTAAAFEGMPLHVETSDEIAETWRGDALIVLIGNCRRAPEGDARTQANVEDGLLEVTIVEEAPTGDLARDALVHRLFGADSTGTVKLRTPSLSVTTRGDEINYSLDGEMIAATDLRVDTARRALRLPVGEAYEPDPD
ncbi:diacylglycerol/lipid kinase family protein [Halostella litorea]|uniref:diacylglycerol/lipid kinase family protein n=1 Tax=Halostella litorea TaxID=2528831 RepID=UPI001F002E65|nr:YegS/Rv2252/BmrU family lipid kinase [Halostella litorea]